MVDEQYTAKDYVNAFRRRSRIFFGVAGLLLGVAAAFALLLPDYYRSAAEMRIDLEGPNIELLEPVVMTTYADQYVRSLEQKVMKNSNLKRWLDDSGAYSDERDELAEADLIQQLRADIRIQMVYTPVMDERSGRQVNLITGFTTAFTARDPLVAQSIANSVASAFLAEDRATRMDRAASASSFLREQIGAKRQEIVDIESDIATFKEEHAGRLPELMVLNMTTLERNERELESVQREIRTLQQDRFFREAQLQQIEQGSGTSRAHLASLEAEYNRAISLYGPDHPDVIRIRRQVAALTNDTAATGGSPEIAQLEAELAAAQERYSDVHPDVISLKRRIEALRSGGPFNGSTSGSDPVYLQLRAQINAIDSNLQGLRERAEDLRAGRAEFQDRIASMPQVERQYQELQRELQTATLAFDDLRERLAQAQQIESFESGERGARLQQVRSAGAPLHPTGPPRLGMVILGLFAAVTFGGGAAFLMEFTDATIRGSKDIRAVMHTHAIATVPIVQNSVTRSQQRRKMLIMSLNVMIVAAIIMIVVAAISR